MQQSGAALFIGLVLFASVSCDGREHDDSPNKPGDDPFRDVSDIGSWRDIPPVPDSIESVGGMWFVSAWTGDELLVWGGVTCAPNFLCQGGARYSTAAGWAPIAREGAPEARMDATSVWTGSELLVWGGNSEPPRALPDGGRYGPESDTWTEMPRDGSPSPRSEARSVWTGEQMVIWGGLGNPQVPDSYLATGGMFSPESSEWSPMADLGAPSGRIRFSMAWTGSEVIVWGGNATDGRAVDTGAAYSPETDTWRTISGGPRFGMVGTEAAWGDGALFTWNGAEEGLDAIYRPDTDSWERVTEEGAPVRRAGAHVHWTGDGFLIWGGGASVDSPFPRLDGGIFSP